MGKATLNIQIAVKRKQACMCPKGYCPWQPKWKYHYVYSVFKIQAFACPAL